MRLWHEFLISHLPRQQLLGQHRECCALRGNGWGRKQSTVNYVFKYPPHTLYQYHFLVMQEMITRGYTIEQKWLDKNYRGKRCPPYIELEEEAIQKPLYPEHNDRYLKECIDNLKQKRIFIETESHKSFN